MPSPRWKELWERRVVYPVLETLGKWRREYSPRRIDLQWPAHPTRVDFLQSIVRCRRVEDYLEIGCFQDECFSQIPVARKVGVDPRSGGTVRATSDEFFAGNTARFDLVFIDGLHLAEQVVRDVRNALQVLRPNGVIVLHDCLPLDALAQYRRRSSRVWNGDVWKALVEIRTWPQVDAAVCLIDHGLGIVVPRPNSDRVALPAASFLELTFDQLVDDYRKLLRPLGYEAGLQFAVGMPEGVAKSE